MLCSPLKESNLSLTKRQHLSEPSWEQRKCESALGGSEEKAVMGVTAAGPGGSLHKPGAGLWVPAALGDLRAEGWQQRALGELEGAGLQKGGQGSPGTRETTPAVCKLSL